MIGALGYLKTSTEDIWENIESKKQYKPVSVKAGYNANDSIVLRELDSDETITVNLNAFRKEFKLIKASLNAKKHFFL